MCPAPPVDVPDAGEPPLLPAVIALVPPLLFFFVTDVPPEAAPPADPGATPPELVAVAAPATPPTPLSELPQPPTAMPRIAAINVRDEGCPALVLSAMLPMLVTRNGLVQQKCVSAGPVTFVVFL